ncbi:MAG: hypothetical protein E7662_01795 [Ruminococcaceae bacterium]|nr:hypothetical protein [Oscillospiraceae bacterium]
MGKIFEEHGICAAGKLLPYSEYCMLSEEKIQKMMTRWGSYFINCAEKILDEPYPLLDATLYMQFARMGNRSNFEGPYFKRRSMVMTFVLAELAEKKGRFTDRIIDGVWHIMEESTWILPAHNATNKNNPGTPLPDAFFTADENDDVKHIDLFSATTGATMAVIWYLTEGILDPQTPVIRRRMLSQLKQRILHPFYTYEHDWWMGVKGNRLNNWTPWIVSNVLTVLALCEDDDALRESAAEKSIAIIDRFTRDYPSDGGCDEGPGYWGAAGASYFDCLELLCDLSGGKIDVFDDVLVGKMCEYIMNFNISGRRFINFADASSVVGIGFRLVGRMGRRLNNPRLAAFAANFPADRNSININTNQVYRFLMDMQEEEQIPQPFVPAEKLWYDGLQVAITRDPASGMFLALKGGCNGESHNHNDVGQFILFDGADPVILDAGVEQYTRKTFSAQRYTLWAMRSAYHNIPEISGAEQKPGREYHAETVAYDPASGALTLELKHAYPAEAKIDSYRRSASLSGSTATVTDSIRLIEAGSVVFHYLTIDEPIIEGNTIRFASGHTAEFDPSLTASVDAVNLEGGKISREWKREYLWRINLAAKENITEAEYTMILRKN